MRYEVKIGILAIVAIALSLWGYKFIQGSNLLSNSNSFYALYDSVDGLTVGTPVTISGVSVGSVNGIYLDQIDRKVKVTFDIRKGIFVPKATKAVLSTISLLGEKSITLIYEKPCFEDENCAEMGSELEGVALGLLESFTGGAASVNDRGPGLQETLTAQLKTTLDSLEYKLFDPNSDNPVARSTNDLAITMENLKGTTARLQGIMNANAGEINSTMKNLAEVTSALADKQEAIASLIDNANGFTGDLNKLDLDQTMEEVNTTILALKNTLDEADKALGGISTIMGDVSAGKGTLGKLLSDDKMYTRLNATLRTADSLFTDLQERPYRYVPFKGRKRVLKYDRKDEELEEQQQ